MLSLWPHQMTRHQLKCWRLALWCCQCCFQHRASAPVLHDLLGHPSFQGDATDTANYRSITAGKLIIRLCVSIRINGQCGHSQSSSIGLRQGSPLSATLFGIFIDGLQHHLQTTAPAAGVQIWHLRITDLVYADDICLLAGSPQHLQALIDAVVGYCAKYTCKSVWRKQKLWWCPGYWLDHLVWRRLLSLAMICCWSTLTLSKTWVCTFIHQGVYPTLSHL